jgi:subtilisin family serine protease
MVKLINGFFIVLLLFLSGKAEGFGIGRESISPIISPQVIDRLNFEEKVPVLIKLKYESDGPYISRMTTAADPSRFISKEDIRMLQLRFESSFAPQELGNEMQIIHRLDNIPGVTGKISQGALDKLRMNPYVAMIIEDRPIKIHLEESGSLIKRDDAHSLGYTGRGVAVAIIDTGIDTDHPGLRDDLVWEECFLQGGGCPVTGGTRASGPGSAEDGGGHGTHVSGIITSSNHVYRGIAPDADIVAIRVFPDDGDAFSSDLIAAVDWIISNKDTYGIKVINMSLGGGVYQGTCDDLFPFTADVMNAAKNAGITTFASSGNEADTSQMGSPACISSVVSVGAVYDEDVGGMVWSECQDETTQADQITCFSNVSSVLDILAPGAIITSSGIGGGIETRSGTSMATPHAAAVAALLLQRNSARSPDSVKEILKSTGKPIFDSRIGLSFPRIDAVSALVMSVPTDRESWPYPPIETPDPGDDPSKAKPVAVGSIAIGGSMLSIKVVLNQFTASVDIWGAYTRTADPAKVYVLNPDGTTFTVLSMDKIVNALSTGIPPEGAEPWKKNDLGPTDEDLLNIPVSAIPPGTYNIFLLVTPTGSLDSYYLWITYFMKIESAV